MEVYFHLNCLLALALIIFGISTPGFNCLKNVHVEGPPHARRGEDVLLSCKYDMETDLLYAVKWYKFQEEFYRFLPKESPPQKVFPRHGLEVDVERSNARQVYLKNVSLDQTGKYKCVVSAESTFQTLEDVKNLTIVVIGYDGPSLGLDQVSYHPGDVVTANCTTAQKTFPPPNVTWYINEREVTGSNSISTISIPDHDQSLISSTVSTINLTLADSYIPTKLTCRIRLFELYDESATKRVQPIPRQYSVGGPDTLLRSNSKSPPPLKNSASAQPGAKYQTQLLNLRGGWSLLNSSVGLIPVLSSVFRITF